MHHQFGGFPMYIPDLRYSNATGKALTKQIHMRRDAPR